VLRGLAVLALYAGVVAWLTWPLARHLTSHLPMTAFNCEVDNYLVGWTLAHQSRALVEDIRAFPHGGIFHPSPHALLHGEAAFGALPYFIGPFLLSGNPTLALNLLFLGCTVLTAAAVHVAVVRWTASHVGGFLAAWTYVTSHWLLWMWVPSAPNYAVLHFVPLIIILAADTAPGSRRGLALLTLVVLQGLVSVYVAAAILPPLVLLALARLARPVTRAAGVRLLGVVTAGALSLALAYSGHLRVRLANPDFDKQTLYAHVGVPGVTDLPAGLLPPLGVLGYPLIPLVVITGGLAVFTLRGRWREKEARVPWMHGALWTLTGIFLSLQPTVAVWGRHIELPQAYVWPWIQATTRDVARLAIPAHIAVAVLTGVAFAEFARWVGASPQRPRMAGAAAFLARVLVAASIAFAIHGRYMRGIRMPGIDAPLARSYPIRESPAATSAVMRALADPGGPLLELPVGSNPRGHTAAMYRAIYHRRPILNGYNGYWPAGFPERMASACALPDPAALEQLRRETGLELILLHLQWWPVVNLTAPGPYGCATLTSSSAEEPRSLAAAQLAQWRQVVSPGYEGQLEVVLREGDDWLLRVKPSAPAPVDRVWHER
jgi:hypothetical protein